MSTRKECISAAVRLLSAAIILVNALDPSMALAKPLGNEGQASKSPVQEVNSNTTKVLLIQPSVNLAPPLATTLESTPTESATPTQSTTEIVTSTFEPSPTPILTQDLPAEALTPPSAPETTFTPTATQPPATPQTPTETLTPTSTPTIPGEVPSALLRVFRQS